MRRRGERGECNSILTRRLAAEALGTLFLVMAVVGSGIMAEKLAGGNEALALLCNTIATGAVLFVIITIFAPVSGAHFNPAVSLVMLLSRRARSPHGAALCRRADRRRLSRRSARASDVRARPVQLGSTARTGFGQWLGEFIATFGLIATILGCLRFKPERGRGSGRPLHHARPIGSPRQPPSPIRR